MQGHGNSRPDKISNTFPVESSERASRLRQSEVYDKPASVPQKSETPGEVFTSPGALGLVLERMTICQRGLASG